MALPAPPRRRGAGPQPGPAPARRSAAPRARRPVPRGRPGAGDLRLQRHRPEPAGRRQRPLPRHRDRPAARPTIAAHRRSSRPARTSSRPAASPRPCDPAGPTAAPFASSTASTRSTRRPPSPGSSAISIPASSARAVSVCSRARTLSSNVIRTAVENAGVSRATADRRRRLAVSEIRWVRPHGRDRRAVCGRGPMTSSTGSVPTATEWCSRPSRCGSPNRCSTSSASSPLGDGVGVPLVGLDDRSVRPPRRSWRRAPHVPRRQGPGVAHRVRHRRRDRAGADPFGDDRGRTRRGGALVVRRADPCDR